MKSIIAVLIIGLFSQVYSKNFTEYTQGEGSTRNEAIHNALLNGLNEFYGVSISAQTILESGQLTENKTVIIHLGEGVKYKVMQVDFVDKYKITYRANLKITFQKFTPAEGLWRSALIPGWGQYYKGSPVKGAIGLVGTSSLVIGGILSANHSNNMNEKSINSHSNFNRSYYHDEANTYHQLSLICYGIAAGVYALNVFDAVASPVGHSSLGDKLFGLGNVDIHTVFSRTFTGCQLSVLLR
jgi:hypothetical protein